MAPSIVFSFVALLSGALLSIGEAAVESDLVTSLPGLNPPAKFKWAFFCETMKAWHDADDVHILVNPLAVLIRFAKILLILVTSQ